MNLHSLNNEGTEGNQQITRQVTVADENGQLHTVNAVSGDMLKHIQVEHLTALAIQKGLPVCEPAKMRHPSRIAAVDKFAPKGTTDSAVTDLILQQCAVTDLTGTLLTEGRSTARNSVVEWAWLVGLPEQTTTESFIHLKRVADPGAIASGSAGNLGQNIFHRPASSGTYAAVVNVEAARVGFNDLSRQVPDAVQKNRNERYQVLLQSLLYTFLEPNGAQRNTQNPHILGFEGVVTVSYGICPAPTVSPLNDNYRTEVEAIQSTLVSMLGEGTVEVTPFESLSEFAAIVSNLAQNTVPFDVNATAKKEA